MDANTDRLVLVAQDRLQFIANGIDEKRGLLKGVTVAQAGVVAKGHYVLLDKNNQPVSDIKLAVRKLPMATDAKTLQTLMQAAKAMGGSVRTREDHDDRIEARVGSVEGFKLEGDRVTADLDVLDAYKNRDLLFEVASKTPEQIGLSIDFGFDIEVINNLAFVRVKSLHAVDVVDEGAITPRGLFHRISETDQRQLKQNKPMADDNNAGTGVEDVLKAVQALAARCDAMEAQNAKHVEAMEAIKQKFAPPPPPPANADKSEGTNKPAGNKPPEAKAGAGNDKGGPSADPHEPSDEYKALRAELDAVRQDQLKFRQERQALGLKDTPKGGSDKEASAESTEGKGSAAANLPPADKFRALVEEHKTKFKVSYAEASQAVASSHRDVFTAMQASRGIIKKVA